VGLSEYLSKRGALWGSVRFALSKPYPQLRL
jgi:hypothetical protein